YSPDLAAFPDVPGDAPMPIGDEAMWAVVHDGGPFAESTWGQTEAGIEFRHLIWAMAEGECADHIFFQRLRIVNRSEDTFHDIRLGLFADITLGDPSDDLVGYDSTIGLAYIYNAADSDAQLGNPPALAYLLLQGLAEEAEGEVGLFDLQRIRDIRNQPPSAFTFFSHDGVYQDVPSPDDANLPGQLSAALRGELSDGSIQRDPLSGAETRFAAGGNPISQIGWVDGKQHSPGNRVMLLSFGPFDLAPGEFQEIVFSRFTVEGGESRADVQALISYSLCVIELYGYQFPLDVETLPTAEFHGPADFSVDRQWPQPLPQSSSALTLRISSRNPLLLEFHWTDILGRRIADGNVRLSSPVSTITFSRPDVPGGIYFLHLRSNEHNVVRTVLVQ
ncbi:MAG: hypothetical protein KFH87_01825, partial [Bacteroidetes bacterium]|nr:hypothetical protein [Bacteroidota bacterium]